MCEHSCSLDHEPGGRQTVDEDQLHLSMQANSERGSSRLDRIGNEERKQYCLAISKEKAQHEDEGRGLWKKKRRFCKGSQAQYKIKSFRLFHSPNLATKASLIKEQLSMRILQNLKQSKDPNNNTGIKQGSLFVRKNMAGLMARFLWNCTESLHILHRCIWRPIYKSVLYYYSQAGLRLGPF